MRLLSKAWSEEIEILRFRREVTKIELMDDFKVENHGKGEVNPSTLRHDPSTGLRTSSRSLLRVDPERRFFTSP
jgi:hypothetical protein